jgi:hypothetical protein
MLRPDALLARLAADSVAADPDGASALGRSAGTAVRLHASVRAELWLRTRRSSTDCRNRTPGRSSPVADTGRRDRADGSPARPHGFGLTLGSGSLARLRGLYQGSSDAPTLSGPWSLLPNSPSARDDNCSVRRWSTILLTDRKEVSGAL